MSSAQTNLYEHAAMSFMVKEDKFMTQKPYLYLLPTKGAFPISNCSFATRLVEVKSLRSCTSPIDLEIDGFTFMRRRLEQRDLWDAAQGWSKPSIEPTLMTYLETIRTFFQEYFKADQTILFDWRVRVHFF